MCKQKQKHKEVEKREKESRRKIGVYIINMYKVSRHTYDMLWIHLSNTRLVLNEAVVQSSRVFYQFEFLIQSDWNSLVSNSVSVRRHKSMRNRTSSVRVQSSIRNVCVMSSHHSLRMLKVIAQEQVSCAKS